MSEKRFWVTTKQLLDVHAGAIGEQQLVHAIFTIAKVVGEQEIPTATPGVEPLELAARTANRWDPGPTDVAVWNNPPKAAQWRESLADEAKVDHEDLIKGDRIEHLINQMVWLANNGGLSEASRRVLYDATIELAVNELDGERSACEDVYHNTGLEYERKNFVIVAEVRPAGSNMTTQSIVVGPMTERQGVLVSKHFKLPNSYSAWQLCSHSLVELNN